MQNPAFKPDYKFRNAAAQAMLDSAENAYCRLELRTRCDFVAGRTSLGAFLQRRELLKSALNARQIAIYALFQKVA